MLPFMQMYQSITRDQDLDVIIKNVCNFIKKPSKELSFPKPFVKYMLGIFYFPSKQLSTLARERKYVDDFYNIAT